MTSVTQLNAGDIISFETIAPSILNLKYKQVKFAGLVNWAVARSFSDIASLHRSLYPSMSQSEVKDDYKSYSYLTFQNSSGIVQVIGVPWIRQDTLVVSGSENLNVNFPNISPEKKEYLFQLLKANGFSNFQVSSGSNEISS